MNYRDMAFKLFWTAVNVTLTAFTVEVTNADPPLAYGAAILAGIQFISTYVRQRIGATPSEADAVGILGTK